MKFIRPQLPRKEGQPFIFRIAMQEKAALLAVLKLYPLLDAGYHKLSRTAKTTGKTEQEWLEEAMVQQRLDHKKKLGQLFRDSRRFFKAGKHDFLFTLTGEQIEWMLRVLNEIRVGSWVRLGRPEMEEARSFSLTSEQARFLATMEVSGYFQAALLEAFS